MNSRRTFGQCSGQEKYHGTRSRMRKYNEHLKREISVIRRRSRMKKMRMIWMMVMMNWSRYFFCHCLKINHSFLPIVAETVNHNSLLTPIVCIVKPNS